MELVSIITPVYNSQAYLHDTIQCVLNQTYENWELLMVDDISSDRSVEIMAEYAAKDPRISYEVLSSKGGASIARNTALAKAKGRYIAFLDADDLWKPDKLAKQVKFMQEHDYAFTFHPYRYIDTQGKETGMKRLAPNKITYWTMLRGCEIGCLSVMYDVEKVGLVQIPRIDKRNDDAMWITALKTCKEGYALQEELAYYRVGGASLSSGSKMKLLKYHYRLYRDVAKFGVIRSLFFTGCNILTYFYVKKKREVQV